jgi:hypothetical protein
MDLFKVTYIYIVHVLEQYTKEIIRKFKAVVPKSLFVSKSGGISSDG